MTFYFTPSRRLVNLRQAMDRMFEETMAEANQPEREYTLSLNVSADDESYQITALVPGLTAEDLEIEILNNTVSLSGQFTMQQPEVKYLLNELPNGAFNRIITLPTVLDAAKAEAQIKNGVLTLRVPKAEAHRPKVIKVISA